MCLFHSRHKGLNGVFGTDKQFYSVIVSNIT